MTKKSTCYVLGALFVFLLSCEKLQADSSSMAEYPDIQQLVESQIIKLDSKSLHKKVSLDSIYEERTFAMDTNKWRAALSFLLEADPSQPAYVGVFDIYETDSTMHLVLKENERGTLRELLISRSAQQVRSIHATVQEDKEVYTHHRKFSVFFSQGTLSTFEIQGYQKMLFKDTVWFGVRGEVN